MKNKIAERYFPTSYSRNNLYLSMLVLIPVLVVSVVNFFILYTNNLTAIRNDLRIGSESSLEMLNAQFSSMSKIVSQNRMEKSFSAEAQNKIGTVYFPIVQKLRKDAVWVPFFADVGYYSMESEMVYRMNSASSSREYFGEKSDKPVYYENNILKIQPWDEESLRQMGNHIRIMRIKNANHYYDGVLMAVPLEIRSDSPPLSYMLFVMSDDMLANMVNAGEGTDCILHYNGVPIYSSDSGICQMLYEGDEIPQNFFSRDTLIFEKDGVRVSWNISREFLMQRLVPVVLLEAAVTFVVMAVGLMLLIYISRKNYEPVRNLLDKLQPCCDAEPLFDEFKYINFVVDDLIYSKRFYQESVQELRREKFLFYILNNQVEPHKALYKQCLEEGIRVDRKYFACILMEDVAKSGELFGILTSKEKDSDRKADRYSLYITENKYLFLLASDMPETEFEEYLSCLSGEDSKLVKRSGVIEGVQNVRNAYARVCWPEQGKEAMEAESDIPVIEFQLLQEAVETDNTDKIGFALRMIKNDIGVYTEDIRKLVLQKAYAVLCQREAQEDVTLEEVPELADGEECCRILDAWIAYLADTDEEIVSKKKALPRNLHTIMHYIEENYTSPGFSIKCMAAEFGTSPSNLSHQFKKLTGKTLSKFIDELRIAKAEEMLAGGEKIGVIALELGYSTTPVFTETYKRIRGITPSSFRSQYQKTGSIE